MAAMVGHIRSSRHDIFLRDVCRADVLIPFLTPACWRPFCQIPAGDRYAMLRTLMFRVRSTSARRVRFSYPCRGFVSTAPKSAPRLRCSRPLCLGCSKRPLVGVLARGSVSMASRIRDFFFSRPLLRSCFSSLSWVAILLSQARWSSPLCASACSNPACVSLCVERGSLLLKRASWGCLVDSAVCNAFLDSAFLLAGDLRAARHPCADGGGLPRPLPRMCSASLLSQVLTGMGKQCLSRSFSGVYVSRPLVRISPSSPLAQDFALDK